jgi:lipid II:glycine glycyltransferase (peptidoglycan interpeptide bridge formation enzyme)
MSRYEAKEIKSKTVWEEFVLSKNPKSFLQSWNWGEINSGLGEKIYRYGYYKSNKLFGVCLFITQNAKRGKHLIVPGGPILDWSDLALVSTWLATIKKLASLENAWFVRVRPELVDNNENLNLLKSFGFMKAPMHLHSENTWILNIDKDESEILLGMRKNTRYMVRKSLTSKLKINRTKLPKDSEILYELQKETVKRHGFVGFSNKLFKIQLEKFGKDDQATLYTVKLKGKVLVAAIIIFYGDTAYYHHSASSEAARDVPASYFLQWNVILDAKNRGVKYYNFWGIAPVGVTNHRFSGVTVFKTGFGGERIDWLHAMDFPISNKYWITYLFEMVRKKFRKL